MEKTKFKRRMFAVAAIVGMGMTMTQIAFGKESFNAENGGLNYVLPADNGYYFLCGGHLYFWQDYNFLHRLQSTDSYSCKQHADYHEV